MDGVVWGIVIAACLVIWLAYRERRTVRVSRPAIPLRSGFLCCDCDQITPAKHQVCEACGSKAILNLARALNHCGKVVVLDDSKRIRSWSIGRKPA